MMKKNTKSFLLFSLVILIIFSFNYVGGESIKSLFYFFSNPLQKKIQQMGDGMGSFSYLFSAKKTLQQENEELKQEKSQLLWQQSERIRLQEENQSLREVLEVGLNKEFALTSVQIIAKNLEAGWILINKGEQRGLKKNSAVITSDKVFVGQIETLYADRARVKLLTSPGSSIKGKILDSDKGGTGIVAGGELGQLKLQLVPLEYPLISGQLVVSDVSDEEYPSGLVIGQVQKITKNDLKAFQVATLTSSYRQPDSELLFVILNF